jgi:hypothetical protein
MEWGLLAGSECGAQKQGRERQVSALQCCISCEFLFGENANTGDGALRFQWGSAQILCGIVRFLCGFCMVSVWFFASKLLIPLAASTGAPVLRGFWEKPGGGGGQGPGKKIDLPIRELQFESVEVLHFGYRNGSTE